MLFCHICLAILLSTAEAFNFYGGPLRVRRRLPLTCEDPLEAFVSYGGGPNKPSVPEIYDTLTRCPNIQSLSLKIQQGGCVISRENQWNFKFVHDKPFPTLRELRLDGYNFEDGRERFWQSFPESLSDYWNNLKESAVAVVKPYSPESAQKWITAQPESNLDKWLKAMDWSKLTRLELLNSSPQFLQKMKDKLPALKSLKLRPMHYWVPAEEDSSDVRTLTKEFLRSVPRLTSLALEAYEPLLPLSEILPFHCPSLKHLEIHEYESRHASRTRSTLAVPDVNFIYRQCPELTSLALDVNRNGTWPTEVFDALASMENLQSLQLWFELGEDLHGCNKWSNLSSCYGDEPYREPKLNISSANSLFEYLRSHKKGVELLDLTVYAGDWERDYGGGYRMNFWAEERARKYECSLASKEEKNGRWCEDIRAEEREREKIEIREWIKSINEKHHS